MIIKILKYIFIKKIWFSMSIIFFIISLIIIAPAPWKKTNLWIDKNSSLEHARKDYQNKIYDALYSISIPLLFTKYDIVFNNKSPEECDQDIIIPIKKDSFFYTVASEHFKDIDEENEKFTHYKINEGAKIIIRSYPIDKEINYGGPMITSLFDTSGPEINERGEVFPSPHCPELSPSILDYYAKPNILNWIISAFILFFGCVIFFSYLRSVWKNN